MSDEMSDWLSRRNGQLGRNVVELYPGMRGFFVDGQYTTKENDAAKVLRKLFVRLDENDKESGTYYFDPHGKFRNMLDSRYIESFIADPDTFDERNPSGFEADIFDVLQKYKSNPSGLIEYSKQNPSFGVWKQDTVR